MSGNPCKHQCFTDSWHSEAHPGTRCWGLQSPVLRFESGRRLEVSALGTLVRLARDAQL